MNRKRNRSAKYFTRAVAFLLILVTCFCFASCNKYIPGENLIKTEEFGFTDGMFVCYMLKVSLEITEDELIEHGYDDSLPLDKQYYEGKTTWFDEIINRAVSKVTEVIVCCELAKKDGVELSLAEQQSVENELVSLRTEAVVSGCTSVDEFLKLTYNYAVTENDIKNMYVYETLSTKYLESIYEGIKSEIKEDEVLAHLESFDQSTLDHSATRDLCHILVYNESYDYNKDEMKKAADELINKIKEKGLSRESFEAVAKEYSPNATSIYEGLKKGDMISEIDNWLFAEGRVVGDINKSYSEEYGYHIFYYASDNKEVCYFQALGEIVDERMNEWMENALASVKVDVNKKAIYNLEINR